ncbi:hypothetical protein GQ42DRAFT_165907 [Ramicandelaber brevisporus]|nr:hypothetical protein GQ42DRAFT_165907 [Ramicandelaber brevisporus]
MNLTKSDLNLTGQLVTSSTNGYGVSTQHNGTSTVIKESHTFDLAICPKHLEYDHLWWVVKGWRAALAKQAQSSAVENT